MAGNRHVIFASALFLATGCYQGTDEAADIAVTRDQKFNALSLNGLSLNGLSLNGLSLNGLSLNGLSLNGLSLNGLSLNGLSLNGLSLNGLSLNGTEFSALFFNQGKLVWRSGTDFIGAEFTIRASGKDQYGKTVYEDFVVRIDDMTLDPNYDDVFLYDLSYRSKLRGDWKSPCADGLPVIPLNNYWDLETGDRIDNPKAITFACTNAVLAKCVEWGYRPWAEATRCKDFEKDKHCYDISLKDYHQACTRMTRADYCGDGKPWTVAGTPIDIWDHLSPQIETPATDWAIEAEWNPDGAYCLSDIRQQAWKEQGMYPKCFLDKKGKPITKKDCGSLKKHRAMLVTAFDKYNEMGK